jgi:hypothetical protein
MFARLQVGELLEMLRPQWFRNDMLATEPFAEVNQLAPVRTKWPELSGKPVAGFFACGTNELSLIWFRWQSF